MRLKAFKFSATLAILLAGMIACSKAPDGILSEKRMQAVLTDMQIAEAMIGVDPGAYEDSLHKAALYESVFRKHKVNQATYDSSLVWYGKNLDLYVKMVERIRNDLDQRIKDLGDVQASATSSTRNDSIDIWPRRPYYVFTPGDHFNGLTFDIKPNRNYSSGSSFVLGMRVWGIHDHMRHKPELTLSVEQPDTIITVRSTIDKDGYVETRLQSIATKQVRRVYGFIRLDNADNDYYKIYVDSLNLMKYNYRSDFTAPADTTVVE